MNFVVPSPRETEPYNNWDYYFERRKASLNLMLHIPCYYKKRMAFTEIHTADCRCFQFQFTPLHKAERRNHPSVVKLLLDHKARPAFQQPVRNIPRNVYIHGCLFVVVFFLLLCFKKYYMVAAEEFSSLHSRLCREHLLVLVTQCAAHRMDEK